MSTHKHTTRHQCVQNEFIVELELPSHSSRSLKNNTLSWRGCCVIMRRIFISRPAFYLINSVMAQALLASYTTTHSEKSLTVSKSSTAAAAWHRVPTNVFADGLFCQKFCNLSIDYAYLFWCFKKKLGLGLN